ncbi:hypothetical protein [Allocoleopsis franciscana]|uniref:Uncharacterized protein n=1 Tax=Allocoleopsis franciscana PCC 7113 TaxID=1173027 RepID=K9WEX8_9CYAN|nr:hypothetical protein [Allocoleopsis franciscana]AFZ18057.1 hypothetical protein Mic7113_2244 [Allocoleopsis franciscana PCC 7113]
MNNEDTFNLGLAFFLNTALIVGFILAISLSSLPQWQNTVTPDEAPTILNSSASLSKNK